MPLGVFARCYPAQNAADLAGAIAADGFATVQLNLSAVGLPTIPSESELAGIDLGGIGADFRRAGLAVWGLSGTYNMAHPDAERAAAQTIDAARLIRRAAELGVTAVTLCTGSRDPENMWRAHPDNDSPEAWADLMTNLGPLLDAADEGDVMLAVEPEPGNVISGTPAALRLVDELGDRARRIGFILDPANLVHGRPAEERDAVLMEAFTRLGDATICVHAKDVITWGERLNGGDGLDFARIRELHAALPNEVPIIIQDATPEQLPAVSALVRGRG